MTEPKKVKAQINAIQEGVGFTLPADLEHQLSKKKEAAGSPNE